ncbi:MAG: MFS transporter [Gammaproteobacteria bacterium RIFCSPHIGHO2_12_FULL_38_14]|nr:MAG: MFS transporter [Gammaproteobacteria bacterium RIFCSPHIGHO2_12_FULL_38_14]
MKTHFRWIVVSLLFFITIVNYIDRSSISYAVDVLAKEFHFTNTDIGLILGAFGVGYVFTTVIGGILVDRYGARRTLFGSIFTWAIALLLTAFSTGFGMLVAARMLLGFAEGPGFPGVTRAVSDWLSARERARALSYALMAVPVGLAIGAPLVSELIIQFTWRGMFFVLTGLTFIWLPFWWFLFRDLPEMSKHVSASELAHIHKQSGVDPLTAAQKFSKRKKVKGLWKFLLSDKTLLSNYWAFFVFGYFLFFFMTWLPTYLLQVYQLDLRQAGLFSTLPWVLGALMMWGVGNLGDYIYAKTNNYRASRTHLIWISQLLAGLCVLPIVLTHDLYLAIILISLAVGFILSANSAYYAVNIDIAKERAGTAMGVMNSCFAVAGFMAPALTGWLTTRTHNFHIAFILLFVLALSSVLLLLLFHRPVENEALRG